MPYSKFQKISTEEILAELPKLSLDEIEVIYQRAETLFPETVERSRTRKMPGEWFMATISLFSVFSNQAAKLVS